MALATKGCGPKIRLDGPLLSLKGWPRRIYKGFIRYKRVGRGIAKVAGGGRSIPHGANDTEHSSPERCSSIEYRRQRPPKAR